MRGIVDVKLKNKVFLILLSSLVVLLLFSIETLASENEWREVTENPVFSIPGDGQDLYYQLGPSQSKPYSSAETLAGVPDVYLKETFGDKKMIFHQYVSNKNISDWLSSGTFYLATRQQNGTYSVYSNLYKNSKIYVNDKKEIKSESNVVFNSNGTNNIMFNVYLIPRAKGSVQHKYVVTNKGSTNYTFIAMKNVDTELNGKDDVPVRMLGNNDGVYIEAGNYRLNYDMSDASGPDNFINMYEPRWRQSLATTTNLPLNYYYKGGKITGTGSEAENYQPGQEIKTKRQESDGLDTGIMMKWNEVTLQPGQSKEFVYDIGMTPLFETLNTYKNLTRESTKNYTGDKIELKRQVHFDKENGDIQNGSITETIDKKLTVVSEFIDFVDEQGNVSRQVKTSDYIKNNELKLPITKTDIVNGNITIKYNVVGSSELENKKAINNISYSFSTSLGVKNVKKNIEIPFASKDNTIVIKYVDQTGKPLQDISEKVVPVKLDDDYDVSTNQYKPNVSGYRLLTEKLPNNAVGKVGEDVIEVVYTYIKQWDVTFESNGGSDVASKTVDTDKTVEKPSDPVKDRNQFLGWYSDTKLSTPWDFSNPVTSDMTLYAKWLQESKLTVKYVDQDGNKIIGVDDKHLNGFLNEDYDVSTDDYKLDIDGYRLDTENLPNNSIGKYTTEPVVVTYVYIKQWVVSFNTNGGSSINSVSVDQNTPVAEPTPPVFDGTEFSGWYTSDAFSQKWDFATLITSDVVLYAKWRSDIVDPDDGITPVTPIDKVTGSEKTQNITKNDLRIQYISDFDFGKEKNSVLNMTINSKSDYVRDNMDKKKNVVPFISIINDTTVGNINPEWSLTATRTNFFDESNHKLRGERLLLSGLNYNNNNNKITPSVTQGKFEIPITGEAVVSKSKNNLGAGSWSMSMGQLDQHDKSSGVELSIPKGTAKNSSNYTTVIDWTLVPGDL